MAFDSHKNFAVGTVATAPSPATSGTSLTLSADFNPAPTPPYNVIICPSGSQPTAANAEVARVTGDSSGVLTITRAQEGSTARTVIVGDQVCAGITAKTLTDIETAIPVVAYVQLSDTTLGSNAATFDLTSISQAYNHLRLVVKLRTDDSNLLSGWMLRFNNDTTTSYVTQAMGGNNTTGVFNVQSNTGSAYGGACTAASSLANQFGVATVEIPSYTDAQVKTCLIYSGVVNSASASNDIAKIQAVIWPGTTAAITRVTLIPQVGSNFVTGSRVTLYGLL